MLLSNLIGIIADDLTEVNDTALQFHLRGANTQVLLDVDAVPQGIKNIQVWAVSTASRRKSAEDAYSEVKKTCEVFKNELGLDYFFKKIDTYFRGNIGVETLSMIENLDLDAAIIIPAFPAENVITVGGYHLIKGVPVERTEIARDVFSPVNESNVVTILKQQLGEKADLVGHLELQKIVKGAGPILMQIKELVASGKKLIIADAVSTTDIEQIMLAVNKSNLKLLPVGTSACAQVVGNNWLPEMKNQHISKKIPTLPKLIVSGSPTQLCSKQIEKLEASDEFENTYFINIDMPTLLAGVTEELVDRVADNLTGSNVVSVYASNLIDDFDGFSDDSQLAEMTKTKLVESVTDFLAQLTKRVIDRRDVILITFGAQTSYKCCKAINSLQLQLIDEVVPRIALSLDYKAQWIVSKSGYTGNSSTLIEILKYFEGHA